MLTATTTSPVPVETDDDHYAQFLTSIQTRARLLTTEGGPIFTTQAGEDSLFAIFLAALPPERRQHYTCNACRRFLDRFGGLVVLSPEGFATPLLDPMSAPTFFRQAVQRLHTVVSRAKITGVFLTSEPVWGLPENASKLPPGIWHHMAWTPARAMLFAATPLLDAGQKMAEKVQDFEMLTRGLREYPVAVVRQAHALLTSGNLYRSEKCIGVAAWLLALHEAIEGTKNEFVREAIVWRAVATAPVGYCHVKSSMIGTLLDDVAVELPFAEIKKRFDEKMNPLQYQRPQAAPTAGNIAQAEKVIAALRTAGALERRFAKIEEVTALWRPPPPKIAAPPGEGVFAHLRAREADKGMCLPPIQQPATTMTWVKFLAEILPRAEKIELYVPQGASGFSALVTAQHLDAPPMLQWDREGQRNPVSWYVYHGGSLATAWGLKPATYVPVTAVCYQPSMWSGPGAFEHQGKSVFFLLDGAWDRNYVNGAGFFPESLKADYHGIRSTLEAYAKSAVIADADKATACGLKLEASRTWTDAIFRVTTKALTMVYTLDRWD